MLSGGWIVWICINWRDNLWLKKRQFEIRNRFSILNIFCCFACQAAAAALMSLNTFFAYTTLLKNCMFRRTFLYRTSIGFDPLLTQDEQFGACHLLISPTNWPQNLLLPMILHILESDRYSTPQKCVSNFFSDFIIWSSTFWEKLHEISRKCQNQLKLKINKGAAGVCGSSNLWSALTHVGFC